MKTLTLLLVLVCIVGLVKSWEWPWQEGKRPWEKPKNAIPSPNPRKFRFVWYQVFEPNLFFQVINLAVLIWVLLGVEDVRALFML